MPAARARHVHLLLALAVLTACAPGVNLAPTSPRARGTGPVASPPPAAGTPKGTPTPDGRGQAGQGPDAPGEGNAGSPGPASLPVLAAGVATVSLAEAGLLDGATTVLTGRVLAPVRFISDASTGVVANNGGKVVANNGGNLLANNGGNVLANNGGNVLANNGAKVLANNGASYVVDGGPGRLGRRYALLAGLEQAPVGDRWVLLQDARGRVVVDGKGQPIATRTAADGSYRLTVPRPSRNLVAAVDMGAPGVLSGFVPRPGDGSATADVDLISTLTTGYILGEYVRPQANPVATFERLPADLEAETRRRAQAAFVTGGVAPPADLEQAKVKALVGALRAGDAPFDAQMEEVRKVLIVGAESAAAFDGPALETPVTPQGLAVGPAGDVYFTDGNLVRVLTRDGNVRTLAGGGEVGNADGVGTAARFNRPDGIAVDRAGVVYVADLGNDAVRRIAPDGTVTTMAVPFDGVSEVAVDAAGTVFVADWIPNALWAVTREGTKRKLPLSLGDGFTFALSPSGLVYASGPVGEGEYALSSLDPTAPGASPRELLRDDGGRLSPAGIAVDATGAVVVVSDFHNTVSRWTPGGALSVVAGRRTEDGMQDARGADARFRFPQAVALDAAGNAYVADLGNHRIRKVAPDGVVTTVAGTGVASVDGSGVQALLSEPRGLAWGPSGKLFVADTGSLNIREIAPSGALSTFAGSGTQGRADGRGRAASFSVPSALAFDREGNLYVVDHQALRRISPDGVVSTPAITGGPGMPFIDATGIAVDATGTIVVAEQVFDKNYGVLAKITPDGRYTEIGPSGVGEDTGGEYEGQLYQGGLALGADGTAFVVDAGARRIFRVPPGGPPGVWAGSGEEAAVDGQGTAAAFVLPVGITLDEAGTAYVADVGSNTVRRVTAGGLVSTLKVPLPAGARLAGPIAVSGSRLAFAAGKQVVTFDLPR